MINPIEISPLILNIYSELKKRGMLNALTENLLLNACLSKNPEMEFKKLAQLIEFSKLFHSPFDMPDASVNGLIKIALTEKGAPVGLNPEECHFLLAGQTGSGKSTLLKLIFSHALLVSGE